MSFADKGIEQSGRTKDGKKFFDVKETRLMDILNVPITDRLSGNRISATS